VVDNGSSDGTVAALARRFPEVAAVALPGNRGAVARTIGVQHCSTAYVAFADDDSWWASGALDRARRELEANPTLGLIAARILVGDENELDPTSSAMAASPLVHPDICGPGVLGFLACGAVVRRDAFLAVGGFPQLIFFGGEEEVLALDLATAGWHLAYVDDVVAHHHPSQVRNPRSRQRVMARNWILSAWLRRPLSVAVARMFAVATGRGGVSVTPRVLIDALRLLPAAVRQRRPVSKGIEAQLRIVEGNLFRPE
jgi:GT2 family glycosyltransferase